MHFRQIISIVVCFLFHGSLFAQKSIWDSLGSSQSKAKQKMSSARDRANALKDRLSNGGLSQEYKHALLLGGKLNSDGWSGSCYIMKRTSPVNNNLFQIHFSELKHEKQTKQKSATTAKLPPSLPPLPYVYGKVNNLYTLQIGVGKERMLLPGVMKGNVSVSYRYNLGFSLAMLKPYYLKLVYVDDPVTDTAHIEEHKFSQADSAHFLDNKSIYGASSWSKSLKETQFVPGAYIETAFAITPGNTKYFIQSITLGANGAFYSRKLPIMADQKGFPWQVSIFGGLALGKRW